MFARRFLGGLVALAMFCTAAAPGAAWAAGAAAADNQYVDRQVPTTTAATPANPANSGTTTATSTTAPLTTSVPAALSTAPTSTAAGHHASTTPAVSSTTPATAPATLTHQAPPSITSTPSSLPNTGLDAGTLALAGLLLLTAGLMIRWHTTRPGPAGPGR